MEFILGSQSILDIGDLRRITERELFLFLMSQKVNRIEYQGNQSKLRIDNVSVVRAEDKSVSTDSEDPLMNRVQRNREYNGAQALYRHSLYPNAIVKYHKILDKYPEINDCGDTYYYLAKSFEAIQENGRARDAYKTVLSKIENDSCNNAKSIKITEECRNAIKRLKE